MTFEHFALNVVDIKGVVNWYCTHLGLTIANLSIEEDYNDIFGRQYASRSY